MFLMFKHRFYWKCQHNNYV